MHSNRNARSKNEWAALVFAMGLPTLATLLYFVALAETAPVVQKTAYSVCKAVQFAFPLCWVLLACRESARDLFRLSGTVRDYLEGILFGLLILGVSWILYQFWLRAEILTPQSAPADAIREKLGGFGLTSLSRYMAFAAFVSLIHSALEEYYWRWFVFGRLRKLVNPVVAGLIGSLAFGAHHVVILGIYFGFATPLTWFLAAAVSIGGAYWCSLYQRTGSLAAPWISHAIIDGAIFLIGYDLLSGSL